MSLDPEPAPDPAVRAALAAAVRAPSRYNTQPWRWEVAGDRVRLWLDRTRVPVVADPGAREARLACGAALFNLTTALGAAGRAHTARLLPDAAEPDLLAEVTLHRHEHRATAAELASAGAIHQRHTSRGPFLDREVPLTDRAALCRAAATERARLRFLDTSAECAPVLDLVHRAALQLEQDRAHRLERDFWTGATHTPVTAGSGVHPVRDFGGDREGRVDLVDRDPLLAVLTTTTDGPRDQLLAGRALQCVLLRAHQSGLAVSYLAPVIEEPTARAALTRRTGAVPHAVLRVGYAVPSPPTPRRSLAQVVSVATARPR